MLLDCVLNARLRKPFTNVPPDCALSVISRTEVNASLSTKFKDVERELKKAKDSRSRIDELKYSEFLVPKAEIQPEVLPEKYQTSICPIRTRTKQ